MIVNVSEIMEAVLLLLAHTHGQCLTNGYH